jgi:hypothetical protein
VLLHDAPEFAPPQLDLDQHLTGHYGAPVARIVRTMQREHAALDTPTPLIDTSDLAVVLASAADKIVAFGSLVHRAAASGDPCGFFTARPGLLALLPHFADYGRAVAAMAPASMAGEYARTLRALTLASSAAQRPPPR